MKDRAVQTAASVADSASATPTRVRYGVVGFAIALAMITYIDRVAISSAAAVPAIRRELGLDEVQMGYVFAAFALAYALFDIPGGFLGDRLGPRRVLCRVVLWWSFFTAATGWAWSYSSLTVTRFLFGAGEAGCFPNLTKAFSTWLPEKEKVRAQGLLWMCARWGGAFTPLVVTPIILVVGWRIAFAIFGSVGLIWAVAFFKWYRDDPMQKEGLNQAERDLVRASAANLESEREAVPWGAIFSSGRVWMLCWQYFALSYGWYFYITWLPTYLRDGRHLALKSTALLSALPLFMGGLANPVSVFLAERLNRVTHDIALTRKVLCCVGFAGAGGCLVYATSLKDPVMSVIIIAMASFFNDLTMPCSWGATMDMGGRFAGTVSGTMNSLGNLSGFIAPVMIGYILKWTHDNWNLTFYVSAAVYATGILTWLFLDSKSPIEGLAE
jgi:MFS family permease